MLPSLAEHYKVYDKPVVIWLELTGCSGNSMSLWNSVGPDLQQVLNSLIDVRYWHFLMSAQGAKAVEVLYKSANENQGNFILVIEGAIATKPKYEAPFSSDGALIDGTQVLTKIGRQAGQVLAVGACASFGGVSAARPNPSGSISATAFLKRPVVNVSGCPAHPDWIIGTLGYMMLFGTPPLNNQGQPLMFYEYTIHQRCQRRSYFDKKVFAKKIGDPECMFKLGCKGPVTYADCPVRQWNHYVNWPVKANTPCIGCANPGFPDAMEPFFEPLPPRPKRISTAKKARTRKVRMRRRRR